MTQVGVSWRAIFIIIAKYRGMAQSALACPGLICLGLGGAGSGWAGFGVFMALANGNRPADIKPRSHTRTSHEGSHLGVPEPMLAELPELS